MSEMLGNQYFLARNYDGATHELEGALFKDGKNKIIKRKLIICYNQIGQITKALQLFLSLIKEDAKIIIDIDPVADDCPCPELVYKYEKDSDKIQTLDPMLRLGMLWLYCDVERSLAYFENTLKENPNNPSIQSVLSILDKYRPVPN
jgi:tetratricopeptide (TPR) repeat protein